MGALVRVGQHPGLQEVAGVGDQRGVLHDAPRDFAGLQVVDTVVAIVETMKLMNSVPAGVAGVVAEFCVANAEFTAQGAALLRIRADR